jgi:hypothetical protein
MQISITPEELQKLVKGEVVKSSNLDIEIKVVKNKISWEDFPTRFSGFYTTVNSGVYLTATTLKADKENKNVFRTEAQARASLALSQLSQWMYLYNEGWEPDWTDESYKFGIYFKEDQITYYDSPRVQTFLAFKSFEIRNKFLEDFKDLIMEAKPLL